MLSFGWRANDLRESIWKDDTAIPRTAPDKDGVTRPDVPVGVLDAWREDGDASHLRPYATLGQPTIIRFRALTPDEKHVATAPMAGAETNVEGYARTLLRCFRIGVSFEDVESIGDVDGVKHNMVAKDRGIRMLAEPMVAEIEVTYPGMVSFYGGLVFNASYAAELEKKASSPPSTPTPSSEAASTTATTGQSPPPEAVSGAP